MGRAGISFVRNSVREAIGCATLTCSCRMRLPTIFTTRYIRCSLA